MFCGTLLPEESKIPPPTGAAMEGLVELSRNNGQGVLGRHD